MRIFFLLFFLTGLFVHLQAQNSADSSNNEVFTYYQTDPKFPGGDTALASFIRRNLIYPEDARRMKLTGTVFVNFYVEKDGSLSDIQVVRDRGLTPSCNQAAIDVMSKSPKWIPGQINGTPARFKRTARIRFDI